MSEREWKPGDVQVVLSLHPSRVQEFATWLRRQCADDSLGCSIAEQINEQGHGTRLVALDPEDREQVERLSAAVPNGPWGPGHVDRLQTALRSLLTPPKPPEPTGLGAVVEAICGCRPEPYPFIREELTHRFDPQQPRGNDPNTQDLRALPWKSGCGHHDWARLANIRVLSEGVTP